MLMILLRDAFGNVVSSATNASNILSFSSHATDAQGYNTTILRYYNRVAEYPGEVIHVFIPTTTGKQWLWVGTRGEWIFNSPFLFMVNDGALSLQATYARWKYDANIFTPYQGVKLYVYQRDAWGNAIGSLVSLQVLIYKGNESQPSPYSDVWSQPATGYGKGTQLTTFTTTASGTFLLFVEDSLGNQIGGCPYKFTVLS